MSLKGIDPAIASPSRVARQLQEQVRGILDRYSIAEVMTEIARLRPTIDICVTAAVKDKRVCKQCGTELENGHGK